MNNAEEFFCTYRDDVYRLAVSYTKNIQEAEDVCQNVFLKLMECPVIRPGKEKAWLMKVTANECRSLLRSNWWKKTVSLEERYTVPSWQGNEVLQSVMKLDPKYRVVIYLHYYEGYTAREIGKLLKISTTAVTTRLSRGREFLKILLKED